MMIRDTYLMRTTITGLILIPLLSGCSVFGVNTVEEADYEVLISEQDYELRLYAPMVIAETYVEADFDEAGNRAFRTLFDYISGDNTSASEIAMTAPVIANQSPADTSESIGMTAPVLNERKDQGWRYMFVLPASYSIDTAPAPSSEDVRLASLPQKRVAVIRFSGLSDEELNNEKTQQLEQWMASKSLKPMSNPRWAGYNPPWTLPFLRRNEVMIDVY